MISADYISALLAGILIFKKASNMYHQSLLLIKGDLHMSPIRSTEHEGFSDGDGAQLHDIYKSDEAPEIDSTTVDQHINPTPDVGGRVMNDFIAAKKANNPAKHSYGQQLLDEEMANQSTITRSITQKFGETAENVSNIIKDPRTTKIALGFVAIGVTGTAMNRLYRHRKS